MTNGYRVPLPVATAMFLPADLMVALRSRSPALGTTRGRLERQGLDHHPDPQPGRYARRCAAPGKPGLTLSCWWSTKHRLTAPATWWQRNSPATSWPARQGSEWPRECLLRREMELLLDRMGWPILPGEAGERTAIICDDHLVTSANNSRSETLDGVMAGHWRPANGARCASRSGG